MISVLTSDSFRGFSTNLSELGLGGAQPVFIGRVLWPGEDQVSDFVIKLYESETCGIANEAIGYISNHLRGVEQPKRAAIILLSPAQLPGVDMSIDLFIDREIGLIPCWATSFEQNTKPFKFVRRLSTFSTKQAKAFYKSKFCKKLSSVDHVTGNNDRHEGNFLYIDDLKYLAIDQGCVGGGLRWHASWPDPSPKNQLIELAHNELQGSDLTAWVAEAILEHSTTQEKWPGINNQIKKSLIGLLDAEAADTIVEYMYDRAEGTTFTTGCNRLI